MSICRIAVFVIFCLCTCLNIQARQRNFSKVRSDNNSTFILYLFIAPDCPISLKYIKTLREMEASFNEEVEFIGLFPKSYSKEELEEFRIEYEIDFDMFIDQNNELIIKYGIKVTPESLLIQDDTVLYQGAIDNWFYALGKNRTRPTEHYLADAIASVIGGKKVAINKTEAIGCIIPK